MTSSGRRSSWIATGAAFVVLVALGTLVWWLQPDDASGDPWPADAERRIATTLAEIDAAGLDAVGLELDPRLDAEDVSIRHVSGGAEPTSPGRSRIVADVEWTPGADSVLPIGHQSSRVTLELAWKDGAFAIVGASALSEPVPLWLVGPLDIETSEHAVIISIREPSAEVEDLGLPPAELATSVARGRAAIDDYDPRLTDETLPVIVAPDSAAGFAAILGRPAGEGAGVAAITTNLGTDAGPVIVVEPEEFKQMDGRARHVVMTHELVHAQSAAVGTRAPLWVVEGYADLVALAGDDVPLELSAGAAVRRGDEGLPEDDEFSGGQHSGAAYEAAWLAWVVLEREFGRGVVGDLYLDALAAPDPAAALERHTGWTLDQLDAQWSGLLTSLG